MTGEEAFLTSGDCYFNTDSLTWYLHNLIEPINNNLAYEW